MIKLITFYTPLYKNSKDDLINSARTLGQFDTVEVFSGFDLIKNKIFISNKRIFSSEIGFGFWAWKAVYLLKVIEKMNDADYLFYVDARSKFTNSIHKLISSFDNEDDIFLFSASPHINSQFTKKETFEFMNSDESSLHSFQVNAAFMGFRKSERSVNFIKYFLRCCLREEVISDNYFNSKSNYPGFISHKYDQSVLSLLASECNIQLYRSPDQFGIQNTNCKDTPIILTSKLNPSPNVFNKFMQKYLILKKMLNIKLHT